jgi:hypothetical protein
MPFQREEKYAAEVGSVFGEYLTTFVSEPRGQVRADVFRQGKRVAAYVSFPTGIDASDVTEPYVRALREYARKEGVADHFQLIMS